MQINNDALKKINSMNDGELKALISSVAKEKNLNIPTIAEADLAKIRAALSNINPSDLEKLQKAFGNRGGR